MKSTGIVRNVDALGRVVIPIELRKTMDLDINEPMEFFTDGDKIILRSYSTGCQFCGSEKNKIYFKDKFVCESCINELRS